MLDWESSFSPRQDTRGKDFPYFYLVFFIYRSHVLQFGAIHYVRTDEAMESSTIPTMCARLIHLNFFVHVFLLFSRKFCVFYSRSSRALRIYFLHFFFITLQSNKKSYLFRESHTTRENVPYVVWIAFVFMFHLSSLTTLASGLEKRHRRAIITRVSIPSALHYAFLMCIIGERK